VTFEVSKAVTMTSVVLGMQHLVVGALMMEGGGPLFQRYREACLLSLEGRCIFVVIMEICSSETSVPNYQTRRTSHHIPEDTNPQG
jgi:hypothetical protein